MLIDLCLDEDLASVVEPRLLDEDPLSPDVDRPLHHRDVVVGDRHRDALVPEERLDEGTTTGSLLRATSTIRTGTASTPAWLTHPPPSDR
jgi:hypothetical protein